MAHAASDPPVYEDGLRSSWENRSWAAVELASTAVVHSGTTSVAVTAAPWFRHADHDRDHDDHDDDHDRDHDHRR